MSYMTDGSPKRAAFEDALARWARDRSESDSSRDGLVLGAISAGISKHRVHVLTGIARTTIDKIVSSHESEQS